MAKQRLPDVLTNRTSLHDLIPLNTPLSVLLSPMDYCNIKCVFCPFHGEVKNDDRNPSIMTMNTFERVVDQLSEFPNKIKALVFCGRGEPTLHKDLPKMIKLAKEKQVAEQIRLTTNGFNLSPELNNKLIGSGLDYIRISVPAIDEKTCFEITGSHLDITNYIESIKHLYINKPKSITVFCKTTNIALGGRNGSVKDSKMEEKFYSLFNDCCDYCFVENIVPQAPRNFSSDDKEKLWIKNSTAYNVYCVENSGSPICERLFYHLTINSLGNVYTCDLNENPNLLLGNVNDDTLIEIWNGEKIKALRVAFLKGNVPNSCKDCSVFTYDFPNNLHNYAQNILNRIER